jgi:Centromere protein Scm3
MLEYSAAQTLASRRLNLTMPLLNPSQTMDSKHNSISPKHSRSPRKGPRSSMLEYSASFEPHYAAIESLANDRITSRKKLQSTWESIIEKYSNMTASEVDEVDLETGEIVVDRGHLRSLHDSTLWDQFESETNDTETLNQGIDEVEDDPGGRKEGDQSELPPSLPSEETIIKQFGEEYGRGILAYLRNQTSVAAKSGRQDFWAGLDDEEAIFSRAKELWRKIQMEQSAHVEERKFNKESFERAVFGLNMGSVMSFEDVVFGQLNANEWTDDNETKYDAEYDENEDNNYESWEIYTTNDTSNVLPDTSEMECHTDPWNDSYHTPRKRLRTPSYLHSRKSPGSVHSILSVTAKEKLRGSVVSGLIATSDEENDLFDITSSPLCDSKLHPINDSPLIPKVTPNSRRKICIRDEDKDEEFIQMRNENDDKECQDISVSQEVIDSGERKAECGDIGYRCTKAFCFTCVS